MPASSSTPPSPSLPAALRLASDWPHAHHWPQDAGSLPVRVRIVEVGPRDGLQAEAVVLDTAIKLELIQRLAAAGITEIEATAFVSPRWVPQMADAAAVMQGIRLQETQYSATQKKQRIRAPVRYSALVPNLRGFEAAAAAGGLSQVVIFGAASEAFSQHNINCSREESLRRFESVAAAARTAGIALRGSLSCCFGCPYQGAVEQGEVLDMVRRLRDLGCTEIDLADTIGVATAGQVRALCEAAAHEFPREGLAGHFHDTHGQALANILAALQAGISCFHTSVGGLGGCPYAPGASGNVATEKVLFLLHGLGIATGIDLPAVQQTGQWIRDCLGRAA